MKKRLHLVVVALFVVALWMPLLLTPSCNELERASLREREKRTPKGTLRFDECDRNVETWVKSVQVWYQESFAFRSCLLSLYNATHYLMRNYPDDVFGAGGELFLSKVVDDVLSPLDVKDKKKIRRNLMYLRTVCEESNADCLFIIIPSKGTVYPELAPSWLRSRNTGARRQVLMKMVEDCEFPVFDLSDNLKECAGKSTAPLFFKYDNHWNVQGARYGYLAMLDVLSNYCPNVRIVTDEDYLIEYQNVGRHTHKRYLDFMLSDRVPKVTQVNLPPVKVVFKDKELCAALHRVNSDVQEVTCSMSGTQRVLFMHDSFFLGPAIWLNHSLPHMVCMGYASHGRDVRKVIETHQPDLLVFALQENSLKKALLGFKRSP